VAAAVVAGKYRYIVRMNNVPYNILMKIVICGNAKVGKSRLATFLSDEPGWRQPDYVPTIGLDMLSIIRTLHGSRKAKVHLMDMSGDERYRGIVASYLRACCAAIIVTDIESENAYDDLREWTEQIRRMNAESHRGFQPQIFVFNNVKQGVDYTKNKDRSKIVKYCRTNGLFYQEVPPDDVGVNKQAFIDMLRVVDHRLVSYGLPVPGLVNYDMEKQTESSPLLSPSAWNPRTSRSANRCCSIL
jgi:small GTP-binding protein